MQVVKSNLFVSTFTQQAGRSIPGVAATATPAFQPRVVCDNTLERQRLEERLSEVQRHVRCVKRAVRVMLFLSALAIVGLGYSTVLIPDWPQTMRQFLMYWPVKAHCALGCASLSCAFLFFCLGLMYRREVLWLGMEGSRLASAVTLGEDPRVIPLITGAGVRRHDWTEPSGPMQDAA